MKISCPNCGVENQANPYGCQVFGCCVTCFACNYGGAKWKTQMENAEVERRRRKPMQTSGICQAQDCGKWVGPYDHFSFDPPYNVMCWQCGYDESFRRKNAKISQVVSDLSLVKSAKAKSVIDLSLASTYLRGKYTTQSEVLVYPIANDTRIEQFFKKVSESGGRVFARPAPLTPVHGFFDSRVVEDIWSLKKLAFEIWRNKPESEILEIILMREVAAEFSGIITPRSITIGRGHDGATNGNLSVTVRTPTSNVGSVITEDLIVKYTKPNESTFVEIVVPQKTAIDNTPQVVQVRSGNEPDNGGNDFIPYDVTVERVHEVTPDTDLIEWQKLTATFVKGDVIYASSLACHGAVHGVVHNIPVITTFVPVVGQQLEAGKIAPINTKRVAALLAKMFQQEEEFKPSIALYGWRLLHAISANLQAGGEEVVAFALFYMLMGGLAACLGEYRHAKGKLAKGFTDEQGNRIKDRNKIFEKAFTDKKFSLQTLFKVWETFLDKGRWSSSSYGGLRWADCSENTAKIAKAIGIFIKSPKLRRLNEAVDAANVLAHCMHNGGLLFTKFGDVSDETISQIFSERVVLEKLLTLREMETSLIEDRKRFTYLRTLTRKLPDRLVNFKQHEEERKRKEYEKALKALEEEKAKKDFAKKQKLAVAELAYNKLVEIGEFEIRDYGYGCSYPALFITYNGGNNHIQMDTVNKGPQVSPEIYETQIVGVKPAKVELTSVEAVTRDCFNSFWRVTYSDTLVLDLRATAYVDIELFASELGVDVEAAKANVGIEKEKKEGKAKQETISLSSNEMQFSTYDENGFCRCSDCQNNKLRWETTNLGEGL